MRRSVPWFLAIVLIALGWTALRDYGVTWDEALGDFFFGQRYLSFFRTFDARYLDFAVNPYAADHVPDLSSSLFRSRPWEYWPVASTLAAATSALLSSVGLLDPFDGFHALNLVLAAILLIALYRFCAREFSDATAVVTVSLLFLMPRVFADLVANIKDFPEMVFFSLTLLVFFRAWESASARWMILAGVVWGLALGTKANALFIAPVVVLFVLLRGFPSGWTRGRSVAMIGGAGAIACGVVFASWPWLWADPVARIHENLTYIASRGTGGTDATSLASSWSMLLFTTPPVVLLLFAIGIIPAVRGARAKNPALLLVVSWIAVVAGRLAIPGAINFDGVRHFLELLPPIAIVAGLGASAAAAFIGQRILGQRILARQFVTAAAIALPIAWCASANLASHPFQTAYWNAFAGGLQGARERQLAQAGDYWAASYRLGLRWLNENAPINSLLTVPIAGHTVELVAPVRLRSDITVVPYPRGGGAVAAAQRMNAMSFLSKKRPLYVMYIYRPEWSTELDRDCEARLRPVQEWRLDDAPLLRIYRYSAP